MSVDECDGGHGESEKSTEEAVEVCREVVGVEVGVWNVHAVGVEFGERGGGYDDSLGVAVLEDGEGEEEGFAEGLRWKLRKGSYFF